VSGRFIAGDIAKPNWITYLTHAVGPGYPAAFFAAGDDRDGRTALSG